MRRAKSSWVSRGFLLAFFVLTFFCWCPVLYSSYGPSDRVFGVPVWALLASGFGIALFILEWVYLFVTGITISDDELEEVVSQLSQVDIDGANTDGEGN